MTELLLLVAICVVWLYSTRPDRARRAKLAKTNLNMTFPQLSH